MKKSLLLSIALLLNTSVFATTVEVETTLGDFTLELNDEKAPITVENFLKYVKSGSYVGTQFHRVIPGFMVQGGGFDKEMRRADVLAPIKNEAGNGLSNKRGTISMARTSIPDSATRQFFINVVDNTNLDKSAFDAGYAVFGEVSDGMDVIAKIELSPTSNYGRYQNVPVNPVIITDMKIVNE